VGKENWAKYLQINCSNQYPVSIITPNSIGCCLTELIRELDIPGEGLSISFHSSEAPNQAFVQSWAIRPPAPEIKIRVMLTLKVVSLLVGRLIG